MSCKEIRIWIKIDGKEVKVQGLITSDLGVAINSICLDHISNRTINYWLLSRRLYASTICLVDLFYEIVIDREECSGWYVSRTFKEEGRNVVQIEEEDMNVDESKFEAIAVFSYLILIPSIIIVSLLDCITLFKYDFYRSCEEFIMTKICKTLLPCYFRFITSKVNNRNEAKLRFDELIADEDYVKCRDDTIRERREELKKENRAFKKLNKPNACKSEFSAIDHHYAVQEIKQEKERERDYAKRNMI